KELEEENERGEHITLCDGHCCSKYHEIPLKITFQKLLKEAES
ncbi:hypothetical protein LCGC14_1920980, partial [marine sediment metagenome]